MSFTSLHYYFFLVLLAFSVSLIKSNALRKNMLLAASYYFYANWDYRFSLLLLFMTVSNYYLGSKIYCFRESNPTLAKKYLFLSVLSSLLVLAIFKYLNFFGENISYLASFFGLDAHVGLTQILLPVGISFYTFQALSYTIDLYRNNIRQPSTLRDFSLFVAFFPQLVAGPIVRAREFLPQLLKVPQLKSKHYETAFSLIVKGLIKKIIFADLLARYFVDPAFSSPSVFSSYYLLLAVIAYSFQIYLDFSAYTDIARGSGLLMGYRLPVNFNRPYLATSISNFWQRWHISMSSFFRDYLFFSLGGSRRGNVYLNIIITFIVIGFWHGAGWNFILYGAAHGILVALERYFRTRKNIRIRSNSAMLIFPILRTFTLVCALRILFRSSSVSESIEYIYYILSNFREPFEVSWVGMFLLICSVIFHYIPLSFMTLVSKQFYTLPLLVRSGLIVSLIYLFIVLGADKAPFVYFQF